MVTMQQGYSFSTEKKLSHHLNSKMLRTSDKGMYTTCNRLVRTNIISRFLDAIIKNHVFKRFLTTKLHLIYRLVAKNIDEMSENTASRISTASRYSTKEDFTNSVTMRHIVELLDVPQVQLRYYY
jgi:hypothetical protein